MKKDGVNMGMKFLGLRYHEDGQLSAATRKGATLAYDRKRETLVLVKEILENQILENLGWEYRDGKENRSQST